MVMHGVVLFCCPCHRYVVYLLKTVAQLTSLILLYTYEIIIIITERCVNKLVLFILDQKTTNATKMEALKTMYHNSLPKGLNLDHYIM